MVYLNINLLQLTYFFAFFTLIVSHWHSDGTAIVTTLPQRDDEGQQQQRLTKMCDDDDDDD